jgi:hypothetical protein
MTLTRGVSPVQGAWAFLIGSYFQLLEALNKQPTKVGQKQINQ